MRRIMKLFEDGNVCVCGLRGRGKDMLMANVVMRRKLPYISNVNYGGQWFPFQPKEFSCGGNSYRNFMDDDVKYYDWPYDDGVDIYTSDLGVYMPAQYCNELNKFYPGIPVFMALSRHLGACNWHFNVQNLNRVWDKVREQSDVYIMCNGCLVLFGKLVFQTVTLYELYDSAVRRVPPFRLRCPLLNADRRFAWECQKAAYDVAHGSIKRRYLIYFNKSNYDTRIFKEVLKNGKKSSV